MIGEAAWRVFGLLFMAVCWAQIGYAAWWLFIGRPTRRG